jgi:hypothetical protein
MSWGVEKTAVIVSIGQRSGILFLGMGRFLFPDNVIEILN